MRQIGAWTRANGGAPAVILLGLALLPLSPLGIAVVAIGIIWFVMRLDPVRKALLRILSAEGDGTPATESGGIQQNFHAPVTINMPHAGAAAYGPPPRDAHIHETGPPNRPPNAAEMEEVKLSDYLEYAPDGPPKIKNRTFRNVIVQGPLLVFPKSHVDFVEVSFGVNGTPDTILWAVSPGPSKVGFVILENVVFENCITESIGVVGIPDDLDEFRRQVGAGPAP